MSTLADGEREVRYHLRDRNPQGYAFTSPEVIHELQATLRVVAPKLLLGDEYVIGLITTVPGTQTYTLPGNQLYMQLQFLKAQDDGISVPVISPVAFEGVQEGDKPSSPSRGKPQFATIREDASQVAKVAFWPVHANLFWMAPLVCHSHTLCTRPIVWDRC